MLTKLRLFEVKEEEPETVEHFVLMKKDIENKIEDRWSIIYMATNYEWVRDTIPGNKEFDAKHYPEKKFEYKIFSMHLPS